MAVAMRGTTVKYWYLIGIVAVGILSNWACQERPEQPPRVIRVAAAASLINVIQKADSLFTDQHPSVKIEEHFAATSILARQLEQGAPFDVFLSANPDWVDYLIQRGLLDSSTVTPLARNVLVVATPDSPPLPSELPRWLVHHRQQRIAIANWHHVPAGKYARTALERMGIWEEVAPYLVQSIDVRAALAYVERGHVGAGIVYRSDVLITPTVHYAAIPTAFQPEIVYEGGLTPSGNSMAKEYLQFLTMPKVQQLFQQFGFNSIKELGGQ